MGRTCYTSSFTHGSHSSVLCTCTGLLVMVRMGITSRSVIMMGYGGITRTVHQTKVVSREGLVIYAYWGLSY